MIPDLVIRRGFLRTPFLPLIFLTVALTLQSIPSSAVSSSVGSGLRV